MANINADTEKLREKGKDIVQLSVDLNEILISLYKRISLMPTSTLEWTGPSANEFVRRINLESEDYFRMKDVLYCYGRFLTDTADELEKKINISKEKLDK